MAQLNYSAPRIAVLIPCYNEEVALPAVIRGFRKALPTADIYVYDNCSVDNTSSVALAEGAIVRYEPRAGKGNVVRRMFADIEADAYVLVDGDDTYEAAAATAMVDLLLHENLATVVGKRIHDEGAAYRPGHVLGNELFTGAVRSIFGESFSDILSGYRVFSRRFVKSFPAFASGFETETEFTVHTLNLQLPVQEIETVYRARPEGSASKLNTYRDGIRILMMIFAMFRNERPLLFFTIISTVLILASLVLTYPLLLTYLDTGLVPRFPTAILATGLALSGLLSLTSGLVLDTVTKGRREARMLAYLAISRWAPRGTPSDDTQG